MNGVPTGIPMGMMTAGAPPPGAGAQPQQNPMAMLQQLAQRGQGGGLPPGLQQLLWFLAGMGYDTFASATAKLRGKEGGAKAGVPPARPAVGAPPAAMMPSLMALRGAGAMPSQT